MTARVTGRASRRRYLFLFTRRALHRDAFLGSRLPQPLPLAESVMSSLLTPPPPPPRFYAPVGHTGAGGSAFPGPRGGDSGQRALEPHCTPTTSQRGEGSLAPH